MFHNSINIAVLMSLEQRLHVMLKWEFSYCMNNSRKDIVMQILSILLQQEKSKMGTFRAKKRRFFNFWNGKTRFGDFFWRLLFLKKSHNAGKTRGCPHFGSKNAFYNLELK